MTKPKTVFPLSAARDVLASIWASKLIDQHDDPEVPESIILENMEWHLARGRAWFDVAPAIRFTFEALAQRGRSEAVRKLATEGLCRE